VFVFETQCIVNDARSML